MNPERVLTRLQKGLYLDMLSILLPQFSQLSPLGCQDPPQPSLLLPSPLTPHPSLLGPHTCTLRLHITYHLV